MTRHDVQMRMGTEATEAEAEAMLELLEGQDPSDIGEDRWARVLIPRAIRLAAMWVYRPRHTHRAKKVSEVGFGGQIDGAKPNPAAHGWTCEIATCSCGAIRLTNRNQGETERGPWRGGRR